MHDVKETGDRRQETECRREEARVNLRVAVRRKPTGVGVCTGRGGN